MCVSMIAIALAACGPAGGDYVAQGAEPFWALTIGARTMRFEAPDGPRVTVATPKVIHGFAGEIYRTRRIDVNLVHKACSDGMSDRVYPDTVTVTVDGKRYRGCGGTDSAPVRPTPLEGEWRIESLYGRPVSPQTRPTVTFRGGRMSGNASCNNVSASYTFARGKLTASPVAGTKKFCGLRVQNVQEHTILGLLAEPLTVTRNRGGKLVLSNARGARMVLAPVRRR